jgi:two-component system KDP operon response regulator KdpE
VNRALIVDDDPQMIRAVRVNLSARGYTVTSASSGRKALSEAATVHPDVVVLDLGLPDLDGVDVIAELRRWTTVPIVVLSGRAGSSDKVEALEAGADDYVTKPFDVDELVARIRAVTRRATPERGAGPVRLGRHIVDLDNRRVTQAPVPEATASGGENPAGSGPEVHLTPIQWQLLEVLLRNPGRLISQRQLLTQVWGPQFESETHYVRQYIAQLRHKLEPDPARPRHLVTELGMGYRYLP